MKYRAYQCKKGYEAAKVREKLAVTDEDKRHWAHNAIVWLTRWKAIDA